MNLKYVIAIFLILVTIVTSAYAAEQKTYVLTLNYDDGVVTLESLILTRGIVNEPLASDEGYRLELVSFDGTVLDSRRFDFNLEITGSALPEWFDETGEQIYIPGEEGVETTLTETTEEIITPYFSNAKQINIYNPDNGKILEVSVAHFADLCGDNVCQDAESYESCQADCRSGSADDYCDRVADNICDPDCSGPAYGDVDCVVEEEQTESLERDLSSAREEKLILDESDVLEGASSINDPKRLFFMLTGIIGILVTFVLVLTHITKRRKED